MTRAAAPPVVPRSNNTPLGELALLFLRLGITAFGGPAAHVSMMESEIVRRRNWISAERFLDMFGAANLIPGPSSSELAIYIGYEQAGVAGLLVAGICFILPAALLTGVIGWIYVKFGGLPTVIGILYGIKPVIVAIVAQAVLNLAPKAAKSGLLWAIGFLALIASVAGLDPVLVLLAAGFLGMAAKRMLHSPHGNAAGAAFFGYVAGVAGSAIPVSLLGVFLFFLKMGAVVFGSGYVLLAFLRTDLVDHWHWLTEAQLLDAIAVGQFTPGPVFTTATFIGYLLAGVRGAVIATIGIFLPGFLLVAASRPLLARVRRSPRASAFLDGVNVASLALMAWVAVQLGKAALIDIPTVALAVMAAFVIFRWKLNTAWLVGAGAVVGLLAQNLR
jgi:chromate transporter